LPVLEPLSDGSYRSVVINPTISGARRRALLDNVRRGGSVPPQHAIPVRVIEYEIADRDGNGTGELICLITAAPRGAVLVSPAQRGESGGRCLWI